jgi:uncharacterized protein (TIGR02271 family)
MERRSAIDAAATERPVQSQTEIKVTMTREEVHVMKEPCIKEEVAIKKEPVIETRIVSDTVTSERVDVKDRACD